MKADPLKELKGQILAFLKSQKAPITAEQMMNDTEISSALFQVLQAALAELKADGRIKAISPNQTEFEGVRVEAGRP